MSRTAGFDDVKNYYVYKYVVDSVSGDPTEHEGEVQAFVKAANPWDAIEKAGFTDTNDTIVYGANMINSLADYTESIVNERKHLSKISKQLKVMSDEEESEKAKFLADRECPNHCGKMDEKFRCKECGFGREAEEVINELDKTIKKEKKAGNDTTQLESLRDLLQKELDD
jgi:hypothetical protein|tara:strand:- start:781 stop:1290 length:510 start_codon:yes stop_codon:yes gene_type:complete